MHYRRTTSSMSLRLKASPALGGGGAHTSWRRNENEFRSDGIRCCWDYQWQHPWHSPKLQWRQRKKIKATMEGFGCTGGKIEKADYGYAVDDVKCKDGQEYEIKLDPT
jgi:hypothetical protein